MMIDRKGVRVRLPLNQDFARNCHCRGGKHFQFSLLLIVRIYNFATVNRSRNFEIFQIISKTHQFTFCFQREVKKNGRLSDLAVSPMAIQPNDAQHDDPYQLPNTAG